MARKDYRGNDRYQHQGSAVKLARELRWRPYLWWRYFYSVLWWLWNQPKYPVDDDDQGPWWNLKLLWDIERGMHDVRIGHHFTIAETMERLCDDT